MGNRNLWLLACAVVGMYIAQGGIAGLADSTLPQLLNRGEATLEASEMLAIVKLPGALKVVLAPFVDYLSQHLPRGYTEIVIMLQVSAAASLWYLSGMMHLVSKESGGVAAAQLRWPLFAAAIFNSVGDLALDAFALVEFPCGWENFPALCQVVGIFIGKSVATSGIFFMISHKLLSLAGFVRVLCSTTLVCALCVGLVGSSGASSAVEERPAFSVFGVLTEVWSFCTQRPNMSDWLLYQLLVPGMYFHAVAVLANRYEQFGYKGEDYAAWNLPVALLTLVLIVWSSGRMADASQPLTFVLRMYGIQIVLLIVMLMQYASWSGVATPLFTSVYVLLTKSQDLLFFVFELGEFSFYGRVAKLEPSLVATLVTLQASAFNFSEFFHFWLAPKLVDVLSTCTQGAGGILVCGFDAYPLVAGVLTSTALLYLLVQWQHIHQYQDLGHQGWRAQRARLRDRVLVGFMLLGTAIFTANQLAL